MELNRAGNPLQIYWDFTLRMQDGSAKDFSLEGKSLNLTLITPRGKKSIEDYHVSGNVIDWLFSADYQTTYGDHSLMLEVLAPSGRVISTSTQYNFVRIIDESCLDDDTEEGLDNVLLDEGDSVVLLSTVLHALRIMPVYPEVGPNGNWWVDGVDTGKPSAGMSAYEFAKENGYTGTEAEYAAECADVPVLNEDSKEATAAALEAADNANRAAGEARRGATMANSAAATATDAANDANTAAEAANNAAETSIDQIEAVGRYIGNEVTPAAEAAIQAATKAINAAEAANNAAGSINGATDNANSAAEAANAAATRAERAIEEFGPAIANKADLENGKIIASQLPDYLLGQVMFGGIIDSGQPTYMDVSTSADFRAKFNYAGEVKRITSSEYGLYNGVYFISGVDGYFLGNGINIGDWIISTGNSWKKVDNSDAVTSVAGLVGHVNASALAAALADITDSNSLARKTDLPKKLSELENDIEIGGGGGSNDDSEIKEILSNIVDEEGYLYSNGEKVDMRFTRSLLPVGTSIPASANLNTIEYLKIGKYYCSLNADAKTIKNCPVNVAFSMEVFNPLGTNVDDEITRDYTYRLRVLTQYDTGQRYMQFCRTNGTAGSWVYESWYVTPRVKFALASSKNDGSAAIGATNKGVYVDSTGEIKAMSYTVAKSVPSNAVFTDTNTKVTAVSNHYAPAEDESQQIDAPDGEVVTGIKRDAAGHVVGVVSTPQTGGGGGITTETDPIFSASPAASITEAKKSEWDAKQEKITDLDAIRSGAEKGTTALQSVPSEYVTETELNKKGYATTSALNNKVDKVSGKQLSTQDFTTELKGKLNGIEANAQKNVHSDWSESDTDSDTYVNNRTHYSYDMEQVTSFSIASKNEGDILVAGLHDGVFYRIINNAGGKNEAFHFVEGRKVVIPSIGPIIEAVCAYEDSFCLKLTTPTYGLTDSFILNDIYVEQLDDVYIPETVTRKAEIATINGQSLTEGGDITIEGGGSAGDNVYITDFTIQDLDDAIESQIDMAADLTSLEEALAAHKVILVPYRADDGYLGYGLLSGYAEDLLYFTIFYTSVNGLFYEIEADRGDPTIRTQSIFRRAWSDKQDKFVSGTNIKTINSTSILGKGNLALATKSELGQFTDVVFAQAIEGGGLVYALPDQATGDEDDVLLSRGTAKTINGQSIMRDEDSNDINVAYPIVTTSSPEAVLQPNTVTKWALPIQFQELVLLFGEQPPQDYAYAIEYIARFSVGSDGVQLIVPSNVKWADGVYPAMTNGKTYEISIVDNLATFLEF